MQAMLDTVSCNDWLTDPIALTLLNTLMMYLWRLVIPMEMIIVIGVVDMEIDKLADEVADMVADKRDRYHQLYWCDFGSFMENGLWFVLEKEQEK